MKRAVLAYSGGLDTSVTIRWLAEQGYEVHAVAVDVGQHEDFDEVVERGRLAGAADVRVVNAVDRFATDVSWRTRSRRTRSTRASTRWCRVSPAR